MDCRWRFLNRMIGLIYGIHTLECPTSISIMVNFSVDKSSVLVGHANMIDYDNVVINGSWNGWNGWGVTLLMMTVTRCLDWYW